MTVISARPSSRKTSEEIEALEAEQADYLASLEDDNVVAGPTEWFKQSAWDAPTHRTRLMTARFVESRNAAKDEPAAPGLVMMANSSEDAIERALAKLRGCPPGSPRSTTRQRDRGRIRAR